MTPLTVGQRLFCLGREGEVMQTSTIERITEHSVFVHPDIVLDRADLEAWGSYKIPIIGGAVWSINATVVPGSMIYSRGARVEWSFNEHEVGGEHEYYQQDFETMAEADAFARDRQKEGAAIGVFNLDGIARLYEQAVEPGIIDRVGNRIAKNEDPKQE